MTKSTITREESVQAVFDLKAGYRLGFADIEILKRVARMALSAIDSKPAPVVPDGIERVASMAEYLGNFAAAAIIRQLAANQPQNAPQNIPEIIPGWIPVSERMPPSRHEVLVGRWWGEKPRWCCKWATYIPGHPDAQSSGWLIPGASWTPTHWMPLPAAPQEDINALIPLVSRNEQEVK
ncbi:DUF551 domain-containing protein [Klebsiella sp. K4-170]|uniref:DUF551 domain-containing protein n=1 Tax=Klebsiella sp. K4-170 TaxID=2920184 RepID=UPI0024DE2854|nr:DUF551 domain-containing protein [Klebsiella sp. K4-170]MDK1900992.1 DUF551 domain-containing protein [Klebsiella sp. K4-170]